MRITTNDIKSFKRKSGNKLCKLKKECIDYAMSYCHKREKHTILVKHAKEYLSFYFKYSKVN